MQSTSELYKSIFSGPHQKETRVFVDGTEFPQNRIQVLSTSGALFAESRPMIGSCVAREIDLSFRPGDFSPPRMAEIKVEVRLVSDLGVSEWIPKGTFYIDTRITDTPGKICTIHGYDAMLKAEQTFLTEDDGGDWPRPAPELATQIAERMGVALDERTVLDESCLVPYPYNYTCRELLGQIGAAHAGNWIITDAGALRMVGLMEMPDETYFLCTETGKVITLGGVAIIVG